MTRATIYHNPRCSKSRQTLALLEERGVDFNVINYLDTPPSVAQLDAFCKALGVEPLSITRTKEARFHEIGLSTDDTRSRQEWLDLLHQNPILIERPIVDCEGKIAIGRPPENVLSIL
jgi:arsenate reductase